jgi:cyanophycinase
VVDLMMRLIDSKHTQAIGLAFGAAEDTPDGKGFEFRFSRDGASSGYESATSEHYSVYRLRLDVRPIAVGWPKYSPR